MTDNTQPEALRLAAWLQAAVQTYPQMSEDEPGGYAFEVDQIMDEAAAELRRLHTENERLAALVEAQQPATHVQNPAEIAHVAGDVSKNGAESNMAQQPAPSAAAHVGDSLFESWFSEYSPAHRGTKQQMRDAYAAGMGDPKAQPSPTPQAESQPAPVLDESAARDECKRKWLAEDEDCNLLEAYDRGWKDRAARAPADPQLLKFYGVTTDAELIAAQARHIERLQAKLPQTPSFAPQQVREG